MSSQIKPRRFYWIVSWVGMIWSLMWALDYVLTKTENPAYIANIPAEAWAYLQNLPLWIMALWAVAVWSGLLGWGMMLLRKRLAVRCFTLSVVTLIANFLYWIPTGGWALQDSMGQGFLFAVGLFAVFGVWFSRNMWAKGILN